MPDESGPVGKAWARDVAERSTWPLASAQPSLLRAAQAVEDALDRAGFVAWSPEPAPQSDVDLQVVPLGYREGRVGRWRTRWSHLLPVVAGLPNVPTRPVPHASVGDATFERLQSLRLFESVVAYRVSEIESEIERFAVRILGSVLGDSSQDVSADRVVNRDGAVLAWMQQPTPKSPEREVVAFFIEPIAATIEGRAVDWESRAGLAEVHSELVQVLPGWEALRALIRDTT